MSLPLALNNTLAHYIVHTFRISNAFDNADPRGLYHTTFYGCNKFRSSISYDGFVLRSKLVSFLAQASVFVQAKRH